MRILKLTLLLLLPQLISLMCYSQTVPFNINIEPLNITGLGGLQAYAFGQHNGKWLIIGGRLDGLHRRQPFAAFDKANMDCLINRTASLHTRADELNQYAVLPRR